MNSSHKLTYNVRNDNQVANAMDEDQLHKEPLQTSGPGIGGLDGIMRSGGDLARRFPQQSRYIDLANV